MQINKTKASCFILLGGALLFSGCGKTENNPTEALSQEKIVGTPVVEQTVLPTNTPLINAPSTNNPTGVLATPNPGDGSAGKTIKEIDSLLGGVSSDEYTAGALDEGTLLAE